MVERRLPASERRQRVGGGGPLASAAAAGTCAKSAMLSAKSQPVGAGLAANSPMLSAKVHIVADRCDAAATAIIEPHWVGLIGIVAGAGEGWGGAAVYRICRARDALLLLQL